MARKLADLGSSRLSRQQGGGEDPHRGVSLNASERARATLGRSLSFGQQPSIPSSCRLSRLDIGRRSASLMERKVVVGGMEESKYNMNKVEEKQKERDSVLHLLNLRLGGRPGQAR